MAYVNGNLGNSVGALFVKKYFDEQSKGDVSFQALDILDDFVIARADGSPTYNFVVAIDDHLMGVNQIISAKL